MVSREPHKTSKDMEETFFQSLANAMNSIFHNFYAVLTGFFTAIVGYFMPVKDIVHLLIIFFILDVIFGYWAANKLRKERFSVKIIWTHTIPRMLVSIVLVLGAYMWDLTYNQDLVSTYKMIGWFISGVLLYSIAENGYQITKWSVFPKLGGLIKTHVTDRTGLDVDDKNTSDNG